MTRALAIRTLSLWLVAALVSGGCNGASDRAPAATEAGFRGDVNALDLDAYRGRVVLLNFWATWCTPCRVEIPDLVRLRRDFAGADLALIGISLDRGTVSELGPKLERFMARYEMNYPVYLDAKQELASRLSGGFMSGVPTTFLIDRQGKVRNMHSGLPHSDGRVDPYGILAREVQALLDEG